LIENEGRIAVNDRSEPEGECKRNPSAEETFFPSSLPEIEQPDLRMLIGERVRVRAKI
jgi:hypothetical protein